MIDQTLDVLKHSRATLISDAVGVVVLFASLFAGLQLAF